MSFLPPPASSGLGFAALLDAEQTLPLCSNFAATQAKWDLLQSSQLPAGLSEIPEFLPCICQNSCVAELLPEHLTGQGWEPLLSQLSEVLLNWSEKLQNPQEEGKAPSWTSAQVLCMLNEGYITPQWKTAATLQGSPLTTHLRRLFSCQGVLISNMKIIYSFGGIFFLGRSFLHLLTSKKNS